MADTIYQGWWQQGFVPGDTPDIRLALATAITDDPAAVNLADLTWTEYDGLGYGRADVVGVAITYAAAEVKLDWTDDDDAFGATVAAATDPIARMIAYLHVDGTAANDVILMSTDQVAGRNGNGGKLGFTLPADGFAVGAQV